MTLKNQLNGVRLSGGHGDHHLGVYPLSFGADCYPCRRRTVSAGLRIDWDAQTGFYVLAYKSPKEFYDNYLAIFKEIVKSFKAVD